MPLYTVEGVVLRTREYGERDRLVTLLDREGVRRTVLAKGVRRPKSSLAAGVQPYTHSRFLLWKGRSLDGVSQVQVLEALTGLRASLEALAAAAYVAELAEAFTQEGAASPGVFPVVLAVLRRLDAAPADGRVHALWLRHAELRLLDLAGWACSWTPARAAGDRWRRKRPRPRRRATRGRSPARAARRPTAPRRGASSVSDAPRSARRPSPWTRPPGRCCGGCAA